MAAASNRGEEEECRRGDSADRSAIDPLWDRIMRAHVKCSNQALVEEDASETSEYTESSDFRKLRQGRIARTVQVERWLLSQQKSRYSDRADGCDKSRAVSKG